MPSLVTTKGMQTCLQSGQWSSGVTTLCLRVASSLAFEIGRGDVIEQQVVFDIKEFTPEFTKSGNGQNASQISPGDLFSTLRVSLDEQHER